MSDNYEDRGLVYCNFGSNPGSYCWLKAAELAISLAFLCACGYEMFKQIKVYGWRMQWRFFALVFMILSLVCNIAYCLWNQAYVLYSLESYFFSLYFLTIVGYVFRLYMRKNQWDTKQNITYAFIIIISLIAILYTAICIDSIVDQSKQAMVNQSCEQVWYLCVNVACLLLCLIALIVLFVNYREETQRMLMLSYSQQQVRSPLKSLWFWMGVNTLAQIIDLIQSGLLIGTDRSEFNCMVIRDNQNANNILLFFLDVLTLTAGYAATLVYFAHVRKSCAFTQQIDLKNSVDMSQDMKGSYGVEMFNAFLQNFTG